MVDNKGQHVAGKEKWGYCGQNCPIPTRSGKSSSDFNTLQNNLVERHKDRVHIYEIIFNENE